MEIKANDRKFINTQPVSYTDLDVYKRRDDEETAGVAFGRLAGEFVRTKVAPEMDAFRFAAYASHSGIGKKAADLSSGDGALTALIEGQNVMDDAEVRCV